MESRLGTRPDLPAFERAVYTRTEYKRAKDRSFIWGLYWGNLVAWAVLMTVGFLFGIDLLVYVSFAFSLAGMAVAILGALDARKEWKEESE